MKEKHYKKEISAYLNHELPKELRQEIAEHLLLCEGCRKTHDEIKLGAVLASRLKQADAPQGTWNEIENALAASEKGRTPFTERASFFGARWLVASAAAVLVVFGLMTAVYFGLVGKKTPEISKNEPPVRNQHVGTPVTAPTANGIPANGSFPPGSQSQQPPQGANARIQPGADQPPPPPGGALPGQNNPPPTAAAWNVETIAAGRSLAESGKLAVGELLETEAGERAKIQVADIGQVEIAPNSRVRLVNTDPKEHRLSLERGRMQAKIFAPPRLFVVDTPSAVAVDLGCEYTLEVDRAGDSRLHVTSGYVALERDGRESIVPAGAACLTKKGKGLGTPFSDDATAEFQRALYDFDFEGGGGAALRRVIRESNLYDALTLWHLLARVAPGERGMVFDALAAHVKPPARVSREGVVRRLDKKMLEAWWLEIENVWFE